MKFRYGLNDWKNIERAQENCFLLTNGLGGYSSLTMTGSCSRKDHALLMACTCAPTERFNLITKLEEAVLIEGKRYVLSVQEYVNRTKNEHGYRYLKDFWMDTFPTWIYQTEGVEVKKTLAMKHEENTIAIRYFLCNRTEREAVLEVTPQMQFVRKDTALREGQKFEVTQKEIQSEGIRLLYRTNGKIEIYPTEYIQDFYFSYDSRDGRESVGRTAHNHKIVFCVPAGEKISCEIIYSMENADVSAEAVFDGERERQKKLMELSGISDSIGQQLVVSADQFIVNRESTKGRTIIAGYPFFLDWGRDTMIALFGCCIATKRYEEAKNIFRTFMKYCKNGIMPNTFPEQGNDPFYNTVDASLLFINAVYEYYIESRDEEFIKEAYDIIGEILKYYKEGTDYHIQMDEDGLIMAGEGFLQLTWMDVRIGEVLPTPRHGKPVEINAYWYNALKAAEFFANLLGRESREYQELAEQVKESFLKQFWIEEKGYLRDVISGTKADGQIRCNQIWALSLPFTMLSKEQGKKVVNTVFEKLYTPYGLRTLNREDGEYHPYYQGSQYDRDFAYHQGTVWPFPLGGYYLAYLQVNENSEEAVSCVKEQLACMEACLREGCIGQIAEVYDGELPSVSKGCFAQAWSVGEILKVYQKLSVLAEN